VTSLAIIRLRSIFALLLIAGGIGAAQAEPAQAQLRFCNKTSYVLRAAFAQEAEQAWRVRGWIRLLPGACRAVSNEPVKGKSYYVYAESIMAHKGPIKIWGGTRPFCTGPGTFDLTGTARCDAADQELRRFDRVEPKADEDAWTTDFTESEKFSLNNARIAGTQRLLNDAGYKAGPIDGYLGRRTRSRIDRFKSDHDVDTDEITGDVLLEKLIQVAGEKQSALGFTLCNRTDLTLWSAIGYEENGQMVAKGWWRLAPKACSEVVKDRVPTEVMYTYAQAVTPAGEKIVWGGETPFCTSDVTFDLPAVGACEREGFETRRFEAIDTQGKDGWEHNFELGG